MSDNILEGLTNIIEEVEATPFDDLPDVDNVIRDLINEIVKEEDIIRIGGELGRVDLDVLRVEVLDEVILVLANTPDYWEQVKRCVQTIIIFERFLGLEH